VKPRDVSFNQTRAATSIRPCGEIGDTSWAYEERSLKMTKNLIIIACSLVFFTGFGYYTYYVWSDCLEENSVLTCMRMLNK